MKTLSSTIFLLGTLFFAPSMHAQTAQETIQAANGCQPRLYTQLDFFKISSGALKNNSSTSKSIICSIDTEFSDQFEGTKALIVDAWISYQTNGESMPCTLYLRKRGNGGLVDSLTVNLRGGNRTSEKVGKVREFLQVDDMFWYAFDEVYTYLQCNLPAGARVFSIDTAFEVRDY